MKQKRMCNYELLRIYAMMFIILLHSLSYGGVRDHYQIGEYGYAVMNLIRGVAYLGVNCFVMITGWFMCDKTFKLKKVVSIWLQVIFYGGGSLLISILITKQITMKAVLSMFMPITKQSYWFVSCYVLLICLQ